MPQTGSSRFNYSPNKSALGAAGDCTSIIVRGGGKKQIVRINASYLDTNFNVAAGWQGAVPIWGRVLVFPQELRLDQAFASGAANAPNAGTDFTGIAEAPIYDMVFNAAVENPAVFDFSINELANEGRILSQGDGPLTVVLCAAQIPAATQTSVFAPRLHVLWRNVYDDIMSTHARGIKTENLG
jgi:hypothetical protein